MKKSNFIRSIYLFSVILIITISQNSIAQENTSFFQLTDTTKQELKYIGLSPVVLSKNSFEINYFNNLNSFWLAYSRFNPVLNGKEVIDRRRFTRMGQTLSFAYGFSESKRWDVGAEVNYDRLRLDDNARSSPFKIVENRQDKSSITSNGISSAGIRFRAMPFRYKPELTFQAAVAYPLGDSREKRAQLQVNRISMDLILTYYKEMKHHTYYLAQLQTRTWFASDENEMTSYDVAIGFYLVKNFMNHKLYVFPGLSYNARYEQLYDGGRLRQMSYQFLGSLGAQYLITNNLTGFVNFQKPFSIDSGNALVEIVKDSYSSASLGLRYVF